MCCSKGLTRIAGKVAIIISTMGESTNSRYESSLIVEFFQRAMRSLCIDLWHTLLFPGLMEKDDIAGRPEYLEQTFALGRRLGSYSAFLRP